MEAIRRTRRHREHAAAIMYDYHYTCHICGEPGAQAIDHVVPVALGGSDHPDNLRPAHTSCNSRKGASPPPEWAYSQPTMWILAYAPKRVRKPVVKKLKRTRRKLEELPPPPRRRIGWSTVAFMILGPAAVMLGATVSGPLFGTGELNVPYMRAVAVWGFPIWLVVCLFGLGSGLLKPLLRSSPERDANLAKRAELQARATELQEQLDWEPIEPAPVRRRTRSRRRRPSRPGSRVKATADRYQSSKP